MIHKQLFLFLLCSSDLLFCMETPYGKNQEIIRKAVAAIEKGNLEQKKESSRKLLELSLQNDPEALYSLACMYEYGVLNNQPNLELAFKNMKRAADINYGPAFIKMGNYYLDKAKRDVPKAHEYFEKARRYYKEHPMVDFVALENQKIADFQVASFYLLANKDNPDKITTALTILNDNKYDSMENASVALARHYLSHNDYPRAETFFLKALKINPDDLEIKVQLANMYLRAFSQDSKKITFALHALKEGVKNNNPAAIIRLAYYYYEQEKFVDALNTIELLTDTALEIEKDLLEGLIYFHENNSNRDLSKSLMYFEKAIAQNPHQTTALFHKWRIWLEDPELIKDEQSIPKLLQEISQTDNTHVMLRLGIGYKFGIYGLPKDTTKAKYYFKKILDDTDLDSAIHKVLIFSEGFYDGQENITKALSILKDIRLKSKWNESFYWKLQEKLQQQLLEEQQPQQATTQAPKVPRTHHGQQEVKQAAQEQSQQEEFKQAPQDQSQQELFKKSVIADINKKYAPDDNSTVTDIDFKQDTVTIDDPQNGKKIILSFKDLPKNKSFKRVIRKLQYDPRLQQWFNQTPEQLAKKYPNPATIYNHTFAKIVDSYIQLYGQQVPRVDDKREFFIDGEIINTQTGKQLKGTFEYTFYQDQKNGPWVLFHRLFRPDFAR